MSHRPTEFNRINQIHPLFLKLAPTGNLGHHHVFPSPSIHNESMTRSRYLLGFRLEFSFTISRIFQLLEIYKSKMERNKKYAYKFSGNFKDKRHARIQMCVRLSKTDVIGQKPQKRW